jgi:hypothetical protein
VDSGEKLAHTVLASAANVADKDALPYCPPNAARQTRGGAASSGGACCATR